MSHEIRTPMNGFLGMIELALQTSLDAQQREYRAIPAAPTAPAAEDAREVIADEPVEEVLDTSAVLTRVLGNVKLLKELVDLFAEEGPRLLRDVGEAIRLGDTARLARSAHTLKGTVANFKPRAALEPALRLEALGRAGELTGAAELHARLESEVPRLQRALGKLLANPRPKP